MLAVNQFVDQLAHIRNDLSVTQKQLAKDSGIPFGTLRHYVSGRRKPSYAAIVAICRALKVDTRSFEGCVSQDK